MFTSSGADPPAAGPPAACPGVSTVGSLALATALCSFIVHDVLESRPTFQRMHLRLPETCRTTFRTPVLDLTFQSDVHSTYLRRFVLVMSRRIPRFTIHISQHLPVPALLLWAPPDGSTPANSCRSANVVLVSCQALSQPQAYGHVCSLPGVLEVYNLSRLCHLSLVRSSTKSLVWGLPI